MNQTLVDRTVYLRDVWETDVSVTVCQRCEAVHPTVVQSVRSTKTVHRIEPVSTESVKILVQDSVESMLTAESEIMFQSVSAIKDMLEIPSPVVTDPPPHHQDQWIPADLHHVESMQSVEREMEQLPVLVSQDCLEILTLSASQNVQ